VQGKFPKPITLSPTIKVWKLQSLRDWIDSQSVEEVIEFNAVNSNQSGELK
jgi:predicted DNA-binding transcriptional regulator AlpA